VSYHLRRSHRGLCSDLLPFLAAPLHCLHQRCSLCPHRNHSCPCHHRRHSSVVPEAAHLRTSRPILFLVSEIFIPEVVQSPAGREPSGFVIRLAFRLIRKNSYIKSIFFTFSSGTSSPESSCATA